MEHQAAAEVPVAGAPGRAEQAGRRMGVVEMDLAVALVGGDHEVVPFGQRDELRKAVLIQNRAGRVGGRAEIEQLASFPDGLGYGVEIGLEAGFLGGIEIDRLGAGEQGGALVDLVERIGHEHGGCGRVPVDDGLGDREQGLAGAVDGQDVMLRMERAFRQIEPGGQPAHDGLAQLGASLRQRIVGHLMQMADERLDDEMRRIVTGLADREIDVGQGSRWFGILEQGSEPFERIGLELIEIGVHALRPVDSGMIRSGAPEATGPELYANHAESQQCSRHRVRSK